jgi:hypothetical protein
MNLDPSRSNLTSSRPTATALPCSARLARLPAWMGIHHLSLSSPPPSTLGQIPVTPSSVEMNSLFPSSRSERRRSKDEIQRNTPLLPFDHPERLEEDRC